MLRVRRRVADFDDWRAQLGQRLREFQDSGVVSYTLLRMLDDPNEVEVVLDFASADDAQAVARRMDLPETHERLLLAGALEIGSLSISETVETVQLQPPDPT